jgi:hypothetical protein
MIEIILTADKNHPQPSLLEANVLHAKNGIARL